MDAFAAKLRADRETAKLTVRQLADRSQISFSYITKIETGRSGKGISSEIVSALATALGCDELEYLYLAGVIPPPLKNLLANKRSRSFIRELLDTPRNAVEWDRLEAVLSGTEVASFVSSQKSQRESVA